MTPKERLLWLAENYGADIEHRWQSSEIWYNHKNSEYTFKLADLEKAELRLTQSEMERRNPGFEVVEWYGREPKYSGRPLPENEKVVDGWLLRKKVEKNCNNCGYDQLIGHAFHCTRNEYETCIHGSKWIPKQAEPKPVRVKAWVRWAKDGTWHHVTKIQPLSVTESMPSYQLVDEWYSLSKLIKDGCEHTDTPDDETSWQKIGGEGMSEETRRKNAHILLTPATCKCNKQSDIRCPVCDYGLAICSVCGKAENELDSECCTAKAGKERGEL